MVRLNKNEDVLPNPYSNGGITLALLYPATKVVPEWHALKDIPSCLDKERGI